MKKRLVLSICLVLTAGFSANSACSKVFSMQEMNQMRARVHLPMLTGNPSIDIQYLSRECNAGLQFSCTFLSFEEQQLQKQRQMQQGYGQPAGNYQGNQQEFNGQEDVNRAQQKMQLLQDRQDEMRAKMQAESEERERQMMQRKIDRAYRGPN